MSTLAIAYTGQVGTLEIVMLSESNNAERVQVFDAACESQDFSSCSYVALSVGGIQFEVYVDSTAVDDISQSVVHYPSTCLKHLLPGLSRIKPGDVVLDLGCHIGTFALVAAKIGASVIAVDGSKRHCEMLRHSKERNKLDNLQIVNAVIGKESGTAQFLHFGPYSRVLSADEANEISRTGNSERMAATEAMFDLMHDKKLGDKDWKRCLETCSVVQVSEVLDKAGVSAIDFLKIDIEGRELEALSNMSRFFAEAKPRSVMFESHAPLLSKAGFKRPELTEFFLKLGYNLYQVLEDELHQFTEKSVQLFPVADFLATLTPIEESHPQSDFLELSWLIEDLACSSEAEQRAHLGMELSCADKILLEHPRTNNALRILCADDDEHVRNSVSWWKA